MVSDDMFGVWQRPEFQLRSLPLNIRWEATRRHPVYQAFWQPFSLDLDAGIEVQQHVESTFESLRQILLNLIGIGRECPAPSQEFETLSQDDLKSSWMSGAITSITNRQLLSLLLSTLPKKTLGEVGLCMLNAGTAKDIGEEPRKLTELGKLTSLECEGLDDYMDALVSINPAASSRDVTNAVKQHLVELKSNHGLSEQRVPSREKLMTYLEVWDEREGWHGGLYHRSSEKKFIEIAQERQESIKTIHNRYRSAFQLITGHTYSIDNWGELFGHLKFSEIFGELGPATKLRPLLQKIRRDLPEAVISSLPGFIANNSNIEDISAERLLDEIREMISSGKHDQEIADELGLQHPECLPLLRKRIEDL